MKFFNYDPINEDIEKNKVTIELEDELLYKIEKFYIDVLKEAYFEPYDLINGYEEATDDSFYFVYEKNSILDPESYLFLGTTGIVMESFSKFLNYENERNEKNLKELNEYILENKHEIKKHFSNIKTFEGYNNEDVSLELKYEKFNLELANGIIKKFEENCNNFYGRYESQEFSEEKYNISKLLDSENFNNDIRYFVLDKIQELSSTLDEKEIVEISFIGLEKEKNKEIDFQKVEENLLNKGAKILKNIKKDIIDNISYQNGNFEYVYKKNIDKMKDEIENELKEIDKQLKEKDKNNNFEKEL